MSTTSKPPVQLSDNVQKAIVEITVFAMIEQIRGFPLIDTELEKVQGLVDELYTEIKGELEAVTRAIEGDL